MDKIDAEQRGTYAPSEGSDEDKRTGKSVPQEEALISNFATGRTKTKRKRMEDEDEETKAKRRAANRIAAFRSRKRQKDLIESLRSTLGDTFKDNSDARKTNNELKEQLKLAEAENQLLKEQLAVTHSDSQIANQSGLPQVVDLPATASIGTSFGNLGMQNSRTAAVAGVEMPPRTLGIDTWYTSNLLGVSDQLNSPMQGISGQRTEGQNAIFRRIPAYTQSFWGQEQLQYQLTSFSTLSEPHNRGINPSNA